MNTKLISFNLKEQDKEFVKNLKIDKEAKRILSFFDIDLSKPFDVNFIYSAQDYERISSENFEPWKCGFFKGNKIFVLSPSVIDKIGIHKKEEIKGIILHELSHILFRLKNFETIPLFDEGIAGYLGQYKTRIQKLKQMKIDLKLAPKYLMGPKEEKEIGNFYLISFYTVKKLIDKFGKDKLFKFLKILRDQKNKNFETFKDKFKEVFNIPFSQIIYIN
jgi:hypothetical protein